MPARAYRSSPKRATSRPAGSKRRSAPAAPPSGDLINAVIQYADLIVDLGGHRSLLRLSERRMADPVISEPLGREAERLADVAVVWDDEQDEIVRVLDASRGDAMTSRQAMQPFGEEGVELTPEALAYLAADSRRVH